MPCICKTESSRFSLRPNKKLHTGLIGLPQNDLRHIGHVGYDGAVFGDVSFIGDNYDKLPIKVGSTQASHGSALLFCHNVWTSFSNRTESVVINSLFSGKPELAYCPLILHLTSFLSWASSWDRPKCIIPFWSRQLGLSTKYNGLYPPTYINCHPRGFEVVNDNELCEWCG